MSDRLQDLTTAEIQSVLVAAGIMLDDNQAIAFKDFLAKVQGIENAKQAVEMLDRIQKAAA